MQVTGAMSRLALVPPLSTMPRGPSIAFAKKLETALAWRK